jgi:protoheme IX farnesyltransferase
VTPVETASAAALPPPTGRTSWLRDLITLTKPGILLLVLVTTAVGMWLAGPTWPDLPLVVATLAGTGMAAASSAVVNHVWDRDIDVGMSRTAGRPVAVGRISPAVGWLWAGILGIASLVVLLIWVGVLAAVLAALAMFVYGVVYTMWLKRRTHLCTDIGGIAGAIPPMIGWSAVTGGLEAGAWALFAIMMAWQPPHFWALAVIKAEEYRAVGVPMLPVVRGSKTTRNWMLAYTVVLLGVSLLPWWLGLSGLWYLAVATALGVITLIWTWQFRVRPVDTRSARRLFFWSLLYLFILLVVMAVDARPDRDPHRRPGVRVAALHNGV